MKKFAALTFLFFYFSVSSYSGWIVTLSTTSDDEAQYEITIQTQDNNIRWTTPQMELIYNAESGVLTFLNNTQKMYWKGTKENYKEDMEAYVKKMMIEAMGEEAYEEYRNSMESMDEPQEEDEYTGDEELEIIPADETVTLDGYTGKKFRIMINGELREEVWLCQEIDLYNDLDFQELDEFFGEKEYADFYEDSDEYEEMIKRNGFPIREISYDMGEPMDETVLVNAEETSLANSVFEVPPGYDSVEFGELFGQSMY